MRCVTYASTPPLPMGSALTAPALTPELHGGWVVRQKDEGGRQQMGLSAAGQADLQWRMEHLLAYFAAMPLDEITVSEVDDFRLSKVREGTLVTSAPHSLDSTHPLSAMLGDLDLRNGQLLDLPAHRLAHRDALLGRESVTTPAALGPILDDTIHRPRRQERATLALVTGLGALFATR
jgi:hypothetical protein